jgi:serine/threonine protein kinase
LPVIPGYELLSELGHGGMGVVYKARQVSLDRIVAVKMILGARARHFLMMARFLVEAEAVACLAHPNIVRIHEVGVHQATPYVAIEFAPGGSLAGRIRGSPQPPRWSAELVRGLALAVQHAHERGILHRDLKPSNVLLMEDGTPKITDFGLAKFLRPYADVTASDSLGLDPFRNEMLRLEAELLEGFTMEQSVVRGLCRQQLGPFGPEVTSRVVRTVTEILEAWGRQRTQPPGRPGGGVETSLDPSWPVHHGLTEEGTVMGTPQYMAPEQALGLLQHIGPHTDVYSLGAVLYELLAGRPPFTGATKEQIRERVLREPPPPIEPAVPCDLEVVCRKCLEKDPEQRYPSAAELGEDLQRFLEGQAVRASVAPPDRVGPESDFRRVLRDLSTVEYESSPSRGSDGERTRRWWQLWR